MTTDFRVGVRAYAGEVPDAPVAPVQSSPIGIAGTSKATAAAFNLNPTIDGDTITYEDLPVVGDVVRIDDRDDTQQFGTVRNPFSDVGVNQAAAYAGWSLPDGTLPYTMQGVLANGVDQMVAVRYDTHNTNATRIANAIDALDALANDNGTGVTPEFFMCPMDGMNYSETATRTTPLSTASTVVSKLDEVAEDAGGLAIVALPWRKSGQSMADYETFCGDYADNNRNSNVIFVGPMAVPTFNVPTTRTTTSEYPTGMPDGKSGGKAIDPVGMVAGAFARRTFTVGEHANPNLMEINGIAELAPVLGFKLQYTGNDFSAMMHQKAVNTIIRHNGFHFWGAFVSALSGGAAERYINARRVLLDIVRHLEVSNQVAIQENITSGYFDFVVAQNSEYLNGLVNPDQPGGPKALTADIRPHPTKNTDATLNNAQAFWVIEYTSVVPGLYSEYEVVALNPVLSQIAG